MNSNQIFDKYSLNLFQIAENQYFKITLLRTYILCNSLKNNGLTLLSLMRFTLFSLLSFFLISDIWADTTLVTTHVDFKQGIPKRTEYTLLTLDKDTLSLQNIIKSNHLFENIPDLEKLSQPHKTQWLRLRLHNHSLENIFIEVIKYHDDVIFYYPDSTGKYDSTHIKISTPFFRRDYNFTNMLFKVPYTTNPTVYYFKIKSSVRTGLGYLVTDSQRAFNKTVKSFGYFSFYIGIMFIIWIYHIVFYIRIRLNAYLFYSIYLLAFTIYRAITYGAIYFVFEYVNFSYIYYTIPFVVSTVFLLLYSDSILDCRQKLPHFHKLIVGAIIARIVVFFVGLFFAIDILHDPFIDLLLLTPAMLAGIANLKFKQKSTIFFIISFGFIYAGFVYHTFLHRYLRVFDEGFQDMNYLLFNSSILEIIFLSFALSEKYLELKREKEQEHEKTIEAQKSALEKAAENQQLKDQLNSKLEQLVAEKTTELQESNNKLKEQAEEITVLNEMLRLDNQRLAHDLETLNKARILEKDVAYSDFVQMFDTEDKSMGFMSDLKWRESYSCKKCGYKKFFNGNVPFSKKCKSCGYQESATMYTLLEGLKFPIQKALYLTYRIYNAEALNETQIAEEIDLRRATVSTFLKKAKEAKSKIKPKDREKHDWTDILLIG